MGASFLTEVGGGFRRFRVPVPFRLARSQDAPVEEDGHGEEFPSSSLFEDEESGDQTRPRRAAMAAASRRFAAPSLARMLLT